MKTLPFLFSAISLAILGSLLAQAEVRLPRLLSDGMVIQRDASWRMWGWADPGETVRIRLGNFAATTTTTPEGRWEIAMPPMPAGGPHTLTGRGNEPFTLQDVWFGDVWVCSGQSNMELPVERVKDLYGEEIAGAANRHIRHFNVPTTYEFDHPRTDLDGGSWEAATPEAVLRFSAVAWFFARALQEEVDVPIGLINSSVGGSPVEAWMSEEALQTYPEDLQEGIRHREDDLIAHTLAENRAIDRDWEAQLDATDVGLQASPPWYDASFVPHDWRTMEIPGFWDEKGLDLPHGSAWFRREVEIPTELADQPARLDLGTIVDADTTWVNGQEIGRTTYRYPPRRYRIPPGILRPDKNVITIRAESNAGRGEFIPDKPYELIIGDHIIDLAGEWQFAVGTRIKAKQSTTFIRWKPMGLFNAMMAPLTLNPVKGVIWYQGESNAGTPSDYAEKLEAMILDWRIRWGRPALPFLYVQLANFMAPSTGPEESAWATLREQQRSVQKVPYTGMAVAIDLGEWNDIHPSNKKAVGRRLALLARKEVYGETEVVSSGPVVEAMRIRNGQVVLTFSHCADGLQTSDGQTVEGFSVADPDGIFHPAKARIDGDTVILRVPPKAKPQTVRYAWANNPARANLANSAGLPASPFQIRADE